MGRILIALEQEILEWNPDLFIVVGDVNSTVIGAMAANKLGIRLAHVEAGLRSFDRGMPEEFNRILTDHLSDYLFTTSRDADENLKREGIPDERIFFVGNVMVDTLLRFRDYSKHREAWRDYQLGPRGYALLTLHRPSNVDDAASLVKVVELLVGLDRIMPVIFPVHPRTRARLEGSGLVERLQGLPRVTMTPPLGYLAFISLMSDARLVLTDSGGIQEEATVLGVPCLTLRENTERPITIQQGTNRLVGTDPIKVIPMVSEELITPSKHTKRIPDLWDGRAAERIIDILAQG
jgi:UDP-N-acetylglucosamine 2-epimerase (non-hydrolysing)